MITKPRHIVLALSAGLLLSAAAMPASANSGKWKAHSQKSRVHHVDKTYVLKNRPLSNRAYRMQSQAYLVAQNGISAAEAKSIARKQVKGGEVVDISRKGDTYRVRVIAKNGKVVDVLIDANSGRVKR